MSPPLVIVIAYRSDEHLTQCLAALAGDDASAPHVVVVDNAAAGAPATAAQTRAVAEQYGAEYLPADRNLGFAGGVNLALASRWDSTRDVLLLNPDARLDRSGLAALQAALHEQPGTAAVAPALQGLDGSAQRGSWPLPSPAQVWLDALALQGRAERRPFFLVGAVLLLSAAALRALGGLDERYFLYAEEADWQMRARKARWELRLVDTVTVGHEGAGTSSDPLRRAVLFHNSGEVFARRWYGAAGWQVMRAGSLAGSARRALLGPPESRAEARRTLTIYLKGPSRTARKAGYLR